MNTRFRSTTAKVPIEGYRKEMIYKTFRDKGKVSALEQARKLKIKESTVRRWISGWRKSVDSGPAYISIRDLQKLSADTISALPGSTPVKSGDRTVALLIPLKAADPGRLAAVLRRAEALAKGQDTSRDDAALAQFGAVDPVDWSLDAVSKLQGEWLANK